MRFGTDGIRGVYGKTLTEDTAFRLGRALGEKGSVLIGRDNRPSSPSLARAIASGVKSVGAEYLSVGLTTTPALYYLLTKRPYPYAAMVTASHNPPSHNGLKVFTQAGKPSDKERREIEKRMPGEEKTPPFAIDYVEDPAPLDRYEAYFRTLFCDLTGLTVVLDVAGGAGYRFKGLLGTLGAKVILLNAREDGSKINDRCGALHPEICASETVKSGADLGIALDGDGDRIIAVDKGGRILDGDDVLYLLATRMHRKGILKKDKIAVTVMTNGGVIKSLSERGITVRVTPVGDSAVARAMAEEGLNLGGEQSGHVILSDYLATGDGLLTGAALLKSIRDEGPFSIEPQARRYPQVLLGIPVRDKGVMSDPTLLSCTEEIERSLGDGRLLLRASGTEDVVRILVEHPNLSIARQAAEKLGARLQSLAGNASTDK